MISSLSRRAKRNGNSEGCHTKVTGELKVGAKVTIQYTMKAVSVDVKDAGKKAEKKAEPAKTEAKPAYLQQRSNFPQSIVVIDMVASRKMGATIFISGLSLNLLYCLYR